MCWTRCAFFTLDGLGSMGCMCSKRGRGLLSEDQSPASELELETPPVVRFAGESGALHVETGAAVAGSSTRRRAPTRVSIVLDHYATRLGSDTTYCARIMAQPPSRARFSVSLDEVPLLKTFHLRCASAQVWERAHALPEICRGL